MKPWMVVVVLRPTDEERKSGFGPKIVVPLTVVLADTEQKAGFLAGRQLPGDAAGKADRLEFYVRPF